MSTIDFSKLDPSIIEHYSDLGIDTSLFQDLFNQVKPDPLTGQIGPEEVMRYMFRNLDNPLVQKVGQMSQAALKQRVDTYDADFTGYDFNILASTIAETVDDGWWYLSLERFAYVDTKGNFIKQEDAPSIPGAVPKFFLNCEHKGVMRMIEEVTGLPDSATVLRFIKRAIVTPMPGLSAGLPRFLHISVKLEQHREALQPFLDSLPEPSSWAVETPEIASGVLDALDSHLQVKYTKFISLAEVAKSEGNEAYHRKDWVAAAQRYADGAEYVQDALMQKPTEAQRKAASHLGAVCLANRAAVCLMPGELHNVTQALSYSQKAEAYDADYGKAYYRQAKAHEALGEVDKAQEALRRALARSSLATDQTMLVYLNELDVQLD